MLELVTQTQWHSERPSSARASGCCRGRGVITPPLRPSWVCPELQQALALCQDRESDIAALTRSSNERQSELRKALEEVWFRPDAPFPSLPLVSVHAAPRAMLRRPPCCRLPVQVE